MSEKSELKPVAELNEGDYRWFVYDKEQTGLQLVCLEDTQTGITVTTPIANPEKRTAAHKAWAGARQSRAAGTPWEIMHEMGEKGVDPDQKLEDMFENYGHASVGDMARLQVDFEKTPMHFNLALFNQSAINGGQEKSTRYQRSFGKSNLHSIRNYLPADLPEEEIAHLEEQYQVFGQRSLEIFNRTRDSLTVAFTEFYQPEDSSQKAALGSRVLDCARYGLLLGQGSGMSFETSGRDWARIIGEMKAAPIPLYARVAGQVEKLLVPNSEQERALGYLAEAPGLLRHADSAPTVNQNLAKLKEYVMNETDFSRRVTVNREFKGHVSQTAELLGSGNSAGDLLAAQYLALIWPGVDTYELLKWAHVSTLSQIEEKMSKIIFEGHDKFKELPIWTGTTRGLTVNMESYMGELRDFNRHRGMRRFIPMPLIFGLEWDADTTEQIISQGFGLPRYIDEVDTFKGHKEQMLVDFKEYYGELFDFFGETESKYGASIDNHYILNLLPMAHQTNLWMSGDPKQWLYFASQRVRPSGHINYRTLAYDANVQIAQSDPYLSGMKLKMDRPDPASRDEFFDRS